MSTEEIKKQEPQGILEDGRQDEAENLAPEDVPKPKPCTDLGNAERLVEKFGHEILYCPDIKKWCVSRKGRWITDPGGRMNRIAYKVARSIYDEAKDERFTSDEITELKKHAKKSSSKGGIRAMIDLAKWLPGISVPVGLLDSDPWLMNCQNGTLDLRTGELKAHDPNDLITKLLPVGYDPEATCPVWEATIDKLIGSDAEKIGFLTYGVELENLNSKDASTFIRQMQQAA